METSHLEEARKFIAIAESGDAKRAAYVAAAEEIAAELQLRTSQRAIARAIGKDESFVRAIIRWRESGYEADTPWLSDEKATSRAAISHTKATLRDETKTKSVLEGLTDDEVEQVAQSVETERVNRKLYPDRIKPTVGQADRAVRKQQTERLKDNPHEAAARVGSHLGSIRAAVRAGIHEYQDFLALVEDEEVREYIRERVVNTQADVHLAFSEALSGSLDEALTRLLEEVK